MVAGEVKQLPEQTGVAAQEISEVLKSDHMVCKRKFHDLLFGTSKLQESEVVSHLSCRLGGWYYREGQSLLGSESALRELEGPRERVHAIGRIVFDRVRARDINGAMARLDDFESASEEVLRILEQLDRRAAVDWLKARTPSKLVYLGESLGTGVAVELAHRRPPHVLILEAPFDRLAAVGRHHFPFLPVQLILRDRFDSASKIADIEAPLLVFHGDLDEVVPQARGQALFSAAKPNKRWISVPSAGHNTLRTIMGDTYLLEIERFVAEAKRQPDGRPVAH